MKRLSPSQMIHNEILEGLQQGFETEESAGLLSWLINKSVKRCLQEILEQEAKDYLGRDLYQRKQEEHEGYRNGYEPKRVKTAEGEVELKMPQVRGIAPFHSKALPKGTMLSENLRALVVEMYTRGMSTRDIEDAFKEQHLALSRQAVSELTDSLNEEYTAFCQRDLSKLDVVYIFFDGVYEQCRYEAGQKEAILCAWGVLSSGRKMLLSLGLGNKESYECWKGFFRDMIQRGLRQPLIGTTDGAPGLLKAFEECFPGTKRQRCIFHKMQNLIAKLPESSHRELIPQIRAIFNQTNKEVASLAVTKLIEDYAEMYPSFIKCLQDDLEACFAFMEFPCGHHKVIRTTNLIERAFEEHRRRSKVIPGFRTEKSCLKLIFGTLIRVSERWRRVKMSEVDLALLKKLRSLYGWKNEGETISRKIA